MTETTSVDTNKLIEMVQQVLPNVRIITDKKEAEAFDNFIANAEQTAPRIWTLKQFSTLVYDQPKSTKRATAYLFNHRDELDINRPGGFINYDLTHNGWSIPAKELVEFDTQHQYHWR